MTMTIEPAAGSVPNLTLESPTGSFVQEQEPVQQQIASLAVSSDVPTTQQPVVTRSDNILMGSAGTDTLEGAEPNVQLDEFTRRDAILDIVRNNYSSSKKTRTDVAKLLNTIINTKAFSDVRPAQNDRGYMEWLRNQPASVLNLQGVYNNQANPFYGKPELFTNSLRRERMKIKPNFWKDITGGAAGQIPIVPGVLGISVEQPRGDEFAMDLYFNPEDADKVAPEGSEFIASKYGEKPRGGEFYWDSTANNGAGGYQYSRTTSESFRHYKNRLTRAAATGLVEFPVTAVSLGYLANIGLSNAAYKAMTTKEFIFKAVEEIFGEENFEQSNAKKYLDLALEGSPDEAALFAEGIGVTQKDVMEFQQVYGEVLQPFKDALGLGQFGPGEDKVLAERFLEELFVMAPAAFTGIGIALRVGKKKATNVAKSFIRVQELGTALNIPQGKALSAIVGLQAKTLKTLQEKMIQATGKVDDSVMKNINRLDPQEQVRILRQHGVPEEQITTFTKAGEFLKHQRVISSKANKKLLDRYTSDDWIEAPSLSNLSVSHEATRGMQSEAAANFAFSIAEEAFPNSPFIGMGMGVFGAWSGGSVPHFLATRTPARRVVSKFNRDNFRVQKYGVYTAMGNWARSRGDVATSNRMEEAAAIQVLKLYDEFDPKRSADENVLAAYKIAADKKELAKMVQLGEEAKQWSLNVDPEELERLSKIAENTQVIEARLNELFPNLENEINVTLSDLIALPSIAFMEQNLLNNINTSMSFGLDKVPMLAEYTALAARKQQSILAIKKMMQHMGGVKDLPDNLKTFQDEVGKYIDQIAEETSANSRAFNKIVDENYSELADEINNAVKQAENQLERQISDSTGLTGMLTQENQNIHRLFQNERLDAAMAPIHAKVKEAYDAIDYDHVLEGSEGIAGHLEALVLQAERVPQPTRGWTRGAVTPHSILVKARQRFLKDDTKGMGAEELARYVIALSDNITGRKINTTTERNLVLSVEEVEKFEEKVATIIAAAAETTEDAFEHDAYLQKYLLPSVRGRLDEIATIDANSGAANIARDIASDNLDYIQRTLAETLPYIQAKYTVKEFAALRSFYSRNSVTSRIGPNRHVFAKGAETLDDYITDFLKSAKDTVALTGLKEANELYFRFMERFGVGIGKRLLSKTENKQPRFKAVNKNGAVVDPDDASFADFVSNGQMFMPAFTEPFWKGTVNVDDMDEAVDTFKIVFTGADGNIDPKDAQMLIDAFALKMWSKRGERGAGSQIEKNAHAKFVERFEDVIRQAGKSGEDFLSVGGLYKQYNPKKYGELIAEHKTAIKEQAVLDRMKIQGTDTLKNLLDRRKNALKGSVFEQVGGDVSREKLREIIFGRGVRHKGPFPADVRDIERGAEQTAQFAEEMEELLALGIPFDEAQGRVMSSEAAANFKQLLEWAREEGVKTIDGKEVNVYETTKNALKGLLVEELVENSFKTTGKQIPKVNWRMLTGDATSPNYVGLATQDIMANTIDLRQYEEYLRRNRNTFLTLLGSEHTAVLDDLFKVSYAMTGDEVGSTLSGLVKGWSASTMQSQLWAVARKVISVRFVAGMIGFQAYRMQTTKFFQTILSHPQAGRIMTKAMKSTKPLTREELSAFKLVFKYTFGPKIAARITQDHIEDQRREHQRNQHGNITTEQLERQQAEAERGVHRPTYWPGNIVRSILDIRHPELGKIEEYRETKSEAGERLTAEQQRVQDEFLEQQGLLPEPTPLGKQMSGLFTNG